MILHSGWREERGEKKAKVFRCSDVINERFCKPLHSDKFHTPYKQGFTADLIYIACTKRAVSMLQSTDKLFPANINSKKQPPSINFQTTDMLSKKQTSEMPNYPVCRLPIKHLWT